MRLLSAVILLAGVVMAVGGCGVFGQSQALYFVQGLGSGINLGNSLDSRNLRLYKPSASELSYETFWGNPVIDRGQLRAVREAGFSFVRIPVTWEEHMDEEGSVSEIWMERVASVVDMALEEDLYVILDTHHEEWMNLEAEREEEITSRFRALWEQIARQFSGYDQRLLFEGMNEPRLRGSVHEWDEGTPELREMVNHLNREFAETVRKSGGSNQDRYLLICAYATGSAEEALESLEVMEGNIIVSVHMYLPYRFCQDSEGDSLWDADRERDREEIEEAFENLNRLFLQKNIPVILTEFGCVDKDNLEERIQWASFYRELADRYGIPCAWWDNGSTYRLLDREEGTWLYPELVEVLVR